MVLFQNPVFSKIVSLRSLKTANTTISKLFQFETWQILRQLISEQPCALSDTAGFWILVSLSILVGWIWAVISGNKKQKQPIQLNKSVKKAKKYRVKDNLILEDSESDGLMSEGDILFPPESFDDENQ